MAKFGGSQPNAGRKCGYTEATRTAAINKSWDLVLEALTDSHPTERLSYKEKLEIAKMIAVKTVPSDVNVNDVHKLLLE